MAIQRRASVSAIAGVACLNGRPRMCEETNRSPGLRFEDIRVKNTARVRCLIGGVRFTSAWFCGKNASRFISPPYHQPRNPDGNEPKNEGSHPFRETRKLVGTEYQTLTQDKS